VKRIAVLSIVRNAGIFLDKWIAHYGAAFGPENLFLILDGEDQRAPEGTRVHIRVVPHEILGRAAGDKLRAARLSSQARDLFAQGYDIVIATDIDEYIVVDPATGMSLAQYLSASSQQYSLSGLGLDVIQHLDDEEQIDPSRPFLAQRSYAQIASRYTKPSITFRPLKWGSGIHRIKGHNFRIDPNLFLIHTGMIDAQIARGLGDDADRKAQGWGAHQERREKTFRTVRRAEARDGDSVFARARRRMSVFRPIYALNKPGHMKGDAIIRIPARFRDLV